MSDVDAEIAVTAPAFEAWFETYMRGQIISDLYKDDLRVAFATGAAAGRASERETIRQLAIEHNAQCHHADGSGGDFADLIAVGSDAPGSLHRPPQSDEHAPRWHSSPSSRF